ncbi:MAG TPA: hypothetical protein VGQ05_19115 [Streptosporangiaceae bacterium]|jgi:hypothetical protein|nr:hypothetical protein [Streptosporangiaceae bacterium]
MQRPAARFMSALAMVIAAALGTVSCGSPNRAGLAAQGQPQSPGASSRPGSSTPADPPAPSAPPSPPASHRGGSHGRTVARRHRGPCAGLSWQEVTASKPRVMAVPPVPLATSIRLGTHPSCRYDRLVIHFTGRVPGYEVRYVSAKAAGRAARRLAHRGDRFLLITLHPAQAHDHHGTQMIKPFSRAAPYPLLRGYAVVSDFEGALIMVAVVHRTRPFRVGVLHERLYVDVHR